MGCSRKGGPSGGDKDCLSPGGKVDLSGEIWSICRAAETVKLSGALPSSAIALP